MVGFLTRFCRCNPLYLLVNGLWRATSLKAGDFIVIVVIRIVPWCLNYFVSS